MSGCFIASDQHDLGLCHGLGIMSEASVTNVINQDLESEGKKRETKKTRRLELNTHYVICLISIPVQKVVTKRLDFDMTFLM